jgi:hypothetical protein
LDSRDPLRGTESVSLTSNFDYCVQFGLGPVKAIFHLALKNEELFPHNVGPLARNFGGDPATVDVRLLDDLDAGADLAFADSTHIRFTIPFELTIETPDSPDPTLSRVTLRASITAPGELVAWPVDGKDQLGIDFAAVTPADVTVPVVEGLPALDNSRFQAAIHVRYLAMATHRFTQGNNVLNFYDGTRDLALDPPNKPGNPEIITALEIHGTDQFLKVTVPIHATVPAAFGFAHYGMVTFWRKIVLSGGTVSVDMGAEPGEAALATTVDFDGSPLGESQVVAALTPLVVAQLGSFGTITEPWFDDAAAKTLVAQESAAYLTTRKFPFYTPDSGDPEHPLNTPVGFLLPAEGILAVLMNRRPGTEGTDAPPDAFLGLNQIALAVGRSKLDEAIADGMNERFPGVNTDDGHLVETEDGDATLYTLAVTPSDPGDHDESEGHLWTEGTAEVHIDCWPDPDITFSGPIFLRVVITEDEQTCSMRIEPEMGDFDAGQSCCDVFIDLIIPAIGIIMLIVIENMIDEVGGELAEDFAEAEARDISPIPSFVAGVAELQACLEDLNVSSRGLVFPGKLRVRREGRSFEDLADSGLLPRP